MCSRPSSRRYRARYETVATNSVEPLSRNTFHRDGSLYYDITPEMPESVARLVSSGPAAEGQLGRVQAHRERATNVTHGSLCGCAGCLD